MPPERIPSWTVLTNLVSPERPTWTGMSWEFFDLERDAQACYDRHVKLGNCPTKRPFHRNDAVHMGILDRQDVSKLLELTDPMAEIRALLGHIPAPYLVPVREGGGPEDEVKTLVVSVMKMRDALKAG